MHFGSYSEVPVEGGSLRVAHEGDGPSVLALHTTTGSHLSWDMVASAATGVHLVAPDLRGRGESSRLPGPFGLPQQLADLDRVMTHIGRLRDTPCRAVVGHGTGAALAVLFTATRPWAVDLLVLVDGGLSVGCGTPETPDLAPLKERLTATFSSREEYYGLAKQQRAFQHWTPEIREYVDYELAGLPPRIRCRTNFAAIETDAAELATGAADLAAALDGLTCPVVFLRAERGMRDEPEALFEPDTVATAAARIPSMTWRTIPDTSHYTILNTASGASHVTKALAEQLNRTRTEVG